MWITLIGMIVVSFLIIIFIPFYIDIIFKREDTNSSLEVNFILLYGLIKFGIDIPVISIVNRGNQFYLNIREKLEGGQKGKDVLEGKQKISFQKLRERIKKSLDIKLTLQTMSRYLLDKIRIKQLIWETKIGIHNAAMTGITSGILWSIKGILLSIISDNKDVGKVEVNILPVFDKKILETYFDCIIRVKLAYIIIAGIKGLKANLKGGV